MSTLTLSGGLPVCTRLFTSWPLGGETEASALRDVLASNHWGGIRAGSQAHRAARRRNPRRRAPDPRLPRRTHLHR
jgi:hypothetical protein